MSERGPVVDVRWWDTAMPSHAALAGHAVTRFGPGSVATGRICPSCGSAVHGRPWLRLAGRPVHVSLARSGPHLVTVLAGAPVGIDVESSEAVARRWHPDLVCTAAETVDPPSSPEDRAAMWVAKEAVLKQLGTGLATPMTEVTIAAYDIRPVTAPAGYRAALCTGRAGTGSA